MNGLRSSGVCVREIAACREVSWLTGRSIDCGCSGMSVWIYTEVICGRIFRSVRDAAGVSKSGIFARTRVVVDTYSPCW